MFFNNKCNTFFGLNLTLVYTFPMCMAWRFHFPIRNYDFKANTKVEGTSIVDEQYAEAFAKAYELLCVVGYVDQQSASTAYNALTEHGHFLFIMIIIMLDDSSRWREIKTQTQTQKYLLDI